MNITSFFLLFFNVCSYYRPLTYKFVWGSAELEDWLCNVSDQGPHTPSGRQVNTLDTERKRESVSGVHPF